MRLPKQARPVVRNVSTAKIEAGISQSDCEERCASLKGLAYMLCISMCKDGGY